MPVLYGNYELRPGPEVEFALEDKLTGDGRKLGTVLTATLTGKLVPNNPHGAEVVVPTVARLTTVLAMQKELRDAFSVQGQVFEVQGWDGGVPAKFNARVRSVEFGRGLWVNDCDYSVVLEGPEFNGETDDSEHVESASEAWAFEEDPESRSTKVSHVCEARGITVYAADGSIAALAWENARRFVLSRLALGWTAVGDAHWSPVSGATIAAGGAVPLSGGQAWSPSRSEHVDELDGSYSVTEQWVLAKAGAWEESSVATRRVDDNPLYMVAGTVTGTVHGLYADPGDYAARYANALALWTTIAPGLYARAAAAVSPAGGPVIPLGTHPVKVEVEHRTWDGTIAYAYEYNNRTLVNDTYEVYSVAASTGLEDYKTAVSVEGKVAGVAYLDVDTDPAIRLVRAQAQWDRVKGLLLQRAVAGSAVHDLKAFPVTYQVTPDPVEGHVAYRCEFDNRDPETARDEFTVSARYSREDGRTTVAVEGTVTGQRTAGAGAPIGPAADPEERYRNALAYYQGKEPNLLGVAALYVGTDQLNPVPWSRTTAHNPRQGTIAYTTEFNSQLGPTTPGALSELITITDTDSVPVIAVVPVLGKPEGPIIQDMNTVKEKLRSASIECIFPRPSDPFMTVPAGAVSLDRFQPAGQIVRKTEGQTVWSPTTGRVAKTVNWLFL